MCENTATIGRAVDWGRPVGCLLDLLGLTHKR